MSDEKVRQLLRLPWTFVREVAPEGDVLLRVKEIPSVVGTGTTDAELEADLWASLEAALAAFLHFGDPVPMPEGCELMYEAHREERITVRSHGAMYQDNESVSRERFATA